MRSFTISTDRIGPRRWCWIRIHNTVQDLRAASDRLNPGGDPERCACWQPTCFYRLTGGDIEWPRNGYAGLVRLAEDYLTAEIVAHELVHAALAIYRMNIKPDVRLGRDIGQREEDLAYIYGELYASFDRQWHGGDDD